MVHISKRIAEIIDRERRTQEKSDPSKSEHWLADDSGIPRSTLRRSLQGTRKIPAEEVQMMAHSLGLNAADIFNEAASITEEEVVV